MKSLGYLVGGTVAFWVVVFYPARLLWGDSAVLFSAAACLLCLAPSAATLAWSQRGLQGLPEQQLLAVMGGTGLRMVFVVRGGHGSILSAPGLQPCGFLDLGDRFLPFHVNPGDGHSPGSSRGTETVSQPVDRVRELVDAV